MPIYDYKCSECENIYDVFHKSREISDDVVCPSCGSTEHKKLMSAPSISIGAATSAGASATSSCETGGCCGSTCSLD